MISYEKAYKIMSEHLPAPAAAETPIVRSLNTILLEDVTADSDIPPFDKAAMDGYAVISDDTPGTLHIVGECRTGRLPDIRIDSGRCARISTGSPVPEGADSVQMIEKTAPGESEKTVKILEYAKKGGNICFRGEDTVKGETVVPAGTLIKPGHIGVFASVGKCTVKTGRPPSVSVCATGDELVDTAERPAPGQIRNSNTPLLAALLREMGLDVVDLGIVGDSRNLLKRTLKKGLEADILLTTGGVSVGERDYVKEILKELDVSLRFEKVSIKPGKPTVFGTKKDKLVFGLPGNPVSSFVAFHLFVKPALKSALGFKNICNPSFKVALKEDFRTKVRKRDFYAPGRLFFERDRPGVTITRTRGSADLVGFASSNCLVLLPAESKGAGKGEKVTVFPFENIMSKM